MAENIDPRPSYTNEVEKERLKTIERSLCCLLGPYEALIMSIQSLLVWEYPWKSCVLFAFLHVLFWFLCSFSSRMFFLVCIVVMAVVFIDTWKNRIWPEIRVPPKEPEDTDGWTPVHARLLSVPEISTHLSVFTVRVLRTFNNLRSCRRNYPLIFCIGNTVTFSMLAVIGYRFSGYTLSYVTIMGLLLWPSVLYHSMLKKLLLRLDPVLNVVSVNVKQKVQAVAMAVGEKVNFSDGKTTESEAVNLSLPVEEDFIPQTNSEVNAALSKAIDDSEDDDSVAPIPESSSRRLSFSNSEDGQLDFELNATSMPSFDDIDNTDDELGILDNAQEQSGMQFNSEHFGESDSEDEQTISEDLDFSNNAGMSLSSQSLINSGLNVLAGNLVARTINSMMESALHGASNVPHGQVASASSVVSRNGARLTYTCSEEGESIDFQKAEPIIQESDEDDYGSTEHIAEIEKDFDFLHELDSDGE